MSYLRSDPSELKQPSPINVYDSDSSDKGPAKTKVPYVLSDGDLPQFLESHHGTNYGKIPSLEEDVPKDWEVIDDEFLLVYAVKFSIIKKRKF